MITVDDFLKVDMRVGVVLKVEDFPRARNPSYKARVDFGDEIGVKWTAMQATNYRKDELVGMQVIGVVNFAPRNIAGFMSEVLIMGVPQVDGSASMLTPSRPAKIGGRVY
jgi:tRNA-binding protein